MILMVVGVATTSAAGSGPIHLPGASNQGKRCSNHEGTQTWTEFKLEGSQVANGVYTDGTLAVTITNLASNRFDWSANVAVDAVVVKDGIDGANLYRYDPEARGGSGLSTPFEGRRGISHISFCYDLEPVTADCAGFALSLRLAPTPLAPWGQHILAGVADTHARDGSQGRSDATAASSELVPGLATVRSATTTCEASAGASGEAHGESSLAGLALDLRPLGVPVTLAATLLRQTSDSTSAGGASSANVLGLTALVAGIPVGPLDVSAPNDVPSHIPLVAAGPLNVELGFLALNEQTSGACPLTVAGGFHGGHALRLVLYGAGTAAAPDLILIIGQSGTSACGESFEGGDRAIECAAIGVSLDRYASGAGARLALAPTGATAHRAGAAATAASQQSSAGLAAGAVHVATAESSCEADDVAAGSARLTGLRVDLAPLGVPLRLSADVVTANARAGAGAGQATGIAGLVINGEPVAVDPGPTTIPLAGVGVVHLNRHAAGGACAERSATAIHVETLLGLSLVVAHVGAAAC
jgi:hypothetical protein